MSPPSDETILVVYDSRAVHETITLFGLEAHCRVEETDEPDGALDRVRDDRPELVILCAMTENSPAFDLCRRIKADAAGTFLPVVILCLFETPEIRKRVEESGADDFLEVSISTEELQFHVRTLLKAKRLIGEAESRTRNLAQANAEAADLVVRIEEANRRIAEQNAALEERDRRIGAQNREINEYLSRLEQELELARTLQVNLLPSGSADLDGVRVGECYIPAERLCGDYYDYMRRDDGSLLVAVADVTGHGVCSALVSVQVRAVARSAFEQGRDLSGMLSALNEFVLSTFRRDYLLTMMLVEYDPEQHAFSWAGAGHCPMLLFDPASGDAVGLASRQVPLGVDHNLSFPQDRARMPEGGRLLVYTDGITEARNAGGEQFGGERLRTLFRDSAHIGVCDLPERLLSAVRGFRGAEEFEDDVTLVALERTG